MKITQENQKILHRLQSRKPHYDVQQWAREDQNRVKLVSALCEYPYQLRQTSNSVKNLEPHNGSLTSPNTATHTKSSKMFETKTQLPGKKNLVYMGTHELGPGASFKVEIVMTAQK